MPQEKSYFIKTFPSSRQSTFDVGFISSQKNLMKALIELDVTTARQMLRNYRKQTKEKVSFLAWFLKCTSQAVAEYKSVHSLRKGKNKLILFEDVDISVAVEKEINGEKVPLPVVIRKVNEKNLQDIELEIRAAKEQAVQNEDDYILGKNQYKWAMKYYVSLPRFIRLMIWRFILRNPFLIKRMSGTIVVTSIGMMGNITGWVIPASFLPLTFVLGSIVKKPGVVQNRIEIREYLHLSIAIDHDVVDGAPATRFVSRLSELVESGFGLNT